MKKLFVLLTAALLAVSVADAQDGKQASNPYLSNREPVAGIQPGMKYKELKNLYNCKEYTETLSDRYNPAVSGVASFFIPGLGQMICKEAGRGIGFLAGEYGALAVASILATGSITYDINDDVTDVNYVTLLGAAALAVGAIGLDIWSIVDAVRVAKVKNMYEQDLKKAYAFDAKLYPSVNCVLANGAAQPTAGLTLAVRF